jgi:hypothetical protein
MHHWLHHRKAFIWKINVDEKSFNKQGTISSSGVSGWVLNV